MVWGSAVGKLEGEVLLCELCTNSFWIVRGYQQLNEGLKQLYNFRITDDRQTKQDLKLLMKDRLNVECTCGAVHLARGFL